MVVASLLLLADAPAITLTQGQIKASSFSSDEDTFSPSSHSGTSPLLQGGNNKLPSLTQTSRGYFLEKSNTFMFQLHLFFFFMKERHSSDILTKIIYAKFILTRN
jgi:hypothetical protein